MSRKSKQEDAARAVGESMNPITEGELVALETQEQSAASAETPPQNGKPKQPKDRSNLPRYGIFGNDKDGRFEMFKMCDTRHQARKYIADNFDLIRKMYTNILLFAMRRVPPVKPE